MAKARLAFADVVHPEGRLDHWGAALNCIYTLWFREVLRFSRDRSRIVISLVPPLLMVALGAVVVPKIGELPDVRNGR